MKKAMVELRLMGAEKDLTFQNVTFVFARGGMLILEQETQNGAGTAARIVRRWPLTRIAWVEEYWTE
jgi:hypothetical protein